MRPLFCATYRHGESLIITTQSDMEALPTTLWLIEKLGTRIGMPMHSHHLTSNGEQTMLYSQAVAFFPCQSSCEDSCSARPVLFVHVRFILPFPVFLDHCYEGGYEEKALPTDDTCSGVRP